MNSGMDLGTDPSTGLVMDPVVDHGLDLGTELSAYRATLRQRALVRVIHHTIRNRDKYTKRERERENRGD